MCIQEAQKANKVRNNEQREQLKTQTDRQRDRDRQKVYLLYILSLNL